MKKENTTLIVYIILFIIILFVLFYFVKKYFNFEKFISKDTLKSPVNKPTRVR